LECFLKSRWSWRIDLHIHTDKSDGAQTPVQVVEKASQLNLAAISITDHDSAEALEDARIASRVFSLQIVPGIELSAQVHDREVHILGYYIDDKNEKLLEHTHQMIEHRRERALQIWQNLKQAGVDLAFEAIERKAVSGLIGRAHIAKALIEANIVNNFYEAFSRFLGEGGSAYVPKELPTVRQAIDLIHLSGGVAFWAHPGVDPNESYLKSMLTAGLDGLEVMHPSNSYDTREMLQEWCKRYSLLSCGGSDFHQADPTRPGIGDLEVPYRWLIEIKQLLKIRQNAERA
jgi:hypothetical protein